MNEKSTAANSKTPSVSVPERVTEETNAFVDTTSVTSSITYETASIVTVIALYGNASSSVAS
jgi:hypothetical protein